MSSTLTADGWVVRDDPVDERNPLPRLTQAEIDAINAEIAAGSNNYPTGTQIIRISDETVFQKWGVGTAARFVQVGAGGDVTAAVAAIEAQETASIAAVAAAQATAETAVDALVTEAETAEANAEAAQAAAEVARDAALAAARIYASTAAGLAAVASGEYFYTVSSESSETLILWLDNAGVAVDTGKRLPTAALFFLTTAWETGDRTASITITSSALTSGNIQNLIDGDFTASSVGGIWFSGSNVGRYIIWDFGIAGRKVIDKARLWWSASRNQGTFKFQVSNDGSTWTDVSATFTAGTSLTLSGSVYYQDVTLTTQREDGGPLQTGYRYIKMEGVGGSYTNIEWLLEIEFKCANARDHQNIASNAPAAGNVGEVLTRANTRAGEVYWTDPRDNFPPMSFLADVERLLASERYSEARFHADSVYGDDANSGVSSASAKQTIAGLLAMSITKSDSIGLKAGSTFTDKTLEPTTGFKKLIGYGEGSLPLIDCAPAINPASFTAVGGATPNVYSVTLTRETPGTYINDPRYNVWEVSADGTSRRQLRKVTSTALANATAGTVYLTGTDAASVTAYVHPFDSTNPTSDGKTYKGAILRAGVGIWSTSGSVSNTDFDSQYIEGIHTSGQNDGHGSLLSGRDATLKRCLASFGNKHNIIFGDGYAEDCIAYGWEYVPTGGQISFTVYAYNVEGRKARLNRCMAIASPTEPDGSSLYAHGSDPAGLTFDEIVADRFVSVDCGNIRVVAHTQRYNDLLFLAHSGSTVKVSGVTAQNDETLCEVKRMIFWGLRGAGGCLRYPSTGTSGAVAAAATSMKLYDSVLNGLTGSDTVNGATILVSQACTFNVERNIMISRDVDHLQANGVSLGAGSTFKNNVVVTKRAATHRMLWVGTDYANVEVDYNVYVRLTDEQLQFTINGVLYTVTTQAQFDAYKAATGYDTNSILVSALQAEQLFAAGTAGMLAGDLRINPLCELEFVDGTSVVGNCGPAEHYDWNRRLVLPGAPSRIPTPPLTLDESETYCKSPAEWDWYPA